MTHDVAQGLGCIGHEVLAGEPAHVLHHELGAHRVHEVGEDDDQRAPAEPAGEVGELIFSTDRMMKEYQGNPEMTAKTLNEGWLHTGDLLQTDEEGY